MTDDCAYGHETGRKFIYDSDDMRLLHHPLADGERPYGDNWAVWTELRDADGELWYVSDHEEYTLDAEEFGPIEECPVCKSYLLDDGTCPETGTDYHR